MCPLIFFREMKKYIFLTTSIAGPGGIQCYVAAKAKFLTTQGWDVKVISSMYPNTECMIKDLNRYNNEGIPELSTPPFCLSRKTVKTNLNKMVNMIDCKNSLDYDEIIIESHEAPHAFWGEILAQRVNAKHYFYTMNEIYKK